MSTVMEFVAVRTQEASDALARTVKAMPEDKVSWSVNDAGRTALGMVVECGGFCQYVATILSTKQVPARNREVEDKLRQECDTAAKALKLLEDGTAELVAAIRAFPEGDLTKTVTLPFGPGMVMPYREVAVMATWNMTYHLGQINFIQTLYGDHDMH